jgi:hypothetical protein
MSIEPEDRSLLIRCGLIILAGVLVVALLGTCSR